jgi:hypothetical protein
MIKRISIGESEKGELKRFFDSLIKKDERMILSIIEKDGFLNILFTDNMTEDLKDSHKYIKKFVADLEED